MHAITDFETIENWCLGDNKFYGKLAGIWPGQNKLSKYTSRLIVFVFLSSCLVSQISQIVVFFSVDTMVDELLFLLIASGTFFKQYNYVLNEDRLKKLLNGIVYDRMIERPEDELKILKLHNKRAVLFSTFYKGLGVTLGMLFVFVPAVPLILDVIKPLNVSRERITVYPAYFFVDTQEYYYYIQAHMLVCVLLVAIVFIGCDITFVHVAEHGCALLAISGYRLKHAIDETDFLDDKFTGRMIDKSYTRVIQAIIAHKRADEYVKNVDTCHTYYTALAIMMMTIGFTATFVQLTSLEMGMQFITYTVFVGGELVHVLFLTTMGQFTADMNEEVFQNICEAQWYNASVRTQALYVLILRKSQSPPKLTGGGLFTLNMDIFVQILKASFSYYTVLKTA